MAYLDDLAAAIAAVSKTAGPAVARIGGRWRGGSAVVVAKGQLLTNAHNVGDDTVSLTFADGRTVDAQVKGVDVDGDLAVLEADTGTIKPLAYSTAATALGTPVFGLAANGGSGPRVTFGTVSNVAAAFRGPRGRRIAGAIEHTAPLMPGSSGGPLVSADGKLVGINTNRLGGGFYLALPLDAALQARIARLAKGESLETPRLGVGIAPSHAARHLRRSVGLPERDGALVRMVDDDSPAARAGVAVGDLIVAAGGQPVTDADDLHAALTGLGANGKLELEIVRGATEHKLGVSF